MNKRIVFVLVSCLGIAACQNPAPVSVNKDEVQKEVADLFDAYAKAVKAEDIAALSATLADDGLFIGTDPEEFWSKETLMKQFEDMAKDSTASLEFTMEKRDIRLSPEGTTAVVTEQLTIPIISTKILVRATAHARKTDNQWKIDYYSWSMVPKNIDLVKVNGAL